jgi:tetratricopeptide (TPR) repeat protein
MGAAALLCVCLSALAAPLQAQSATGATVDTSYEAVIADAKASMMINPDSARAKAVRAERLASALPDPKARGLAIATAEWLQGEALLRGNNSLQADRPIAHALQLATRLAPQTKLHADILFARGGIASDQGRAGDAQKDYHAAFDIYSKLGDTRGQAMALLYISIIYTDALDQESALKYSKQALDVYKSDPNLSVSIYNNRGVAFGELGQHELAISQYLQALRLARQLKRSSTISPASVSPRTIYLRPIARLTKVWVLQQIMTSQARKPN